MKKVLLLISMIALSNCTRYQIQVRPVDGTVYYTPMKRVNLRWVEHYNSPTYKQGALDQIEFWKKLDYQKKVNKKSVYIKIK
jgi:hypothetical protein